MRYRCDCGNDECKITFNSFQQGQRCMKCGIKKTIEKTKNTFKNIKQYFKEHDCELLETEYINANTPMKYECDCGNTDCKITFNRFQQGGRCKRCGLKKMADKIKLTFKEVQQYFEDHDCELFETEYKNCNTKMRYRCSCGNEKCKITFASFKAGSRCKRCGLKKMADKRRLEFKDVYKYFEDHDCELLETEYKNCETPMKFRCICGNKKCKITFHSFKKGTRCKRCMKHGSTKKLTYEEVQQYFEDHDCELLEKEYKNANTKMKYRCDCGNEKCKITLGHFKNGKRCMECSIKRRSGKNAYNYNFNLTDKERNDRRDSPENKKWRKDVYEKNNFICQYCNKGGKLIAHHIESYRDNEELRLIISNGITFCEEHHIEFHKEYGYGHNNRKQLEEYLSTRSLII